MESVFPLQLSEFDISETTGFLVENPLDHLPENFEPWHVLARDMPELVQQRKLRERVLKTPLLDWKKLENTRQKRLAHLQLSIITSGYVWQDGTDQPPKVLPACLAVPLWNVSKDLGIQPIVSHPGLFLANWRLKDPSKLPILSNIACLYSLPGGEDSEWFIIILNAMEMEFANGIKSIVTGTHSVDTNDHEGLSLALTGIRESLMTMKTILSQVHSHIRSSVFYFELRPFLSGWGKQGSPLSDGLIFEGVSDVPIKCSSDTGAQSSIHSCLDAFLDIKHSEDSRSFLVRMRDYMPPSHRRFIEVLETRTSTRDFVVNSGSETLNKAYNDVLEMFTELRNIHIQIVAKYITAYDSKSKDGETTNAEVVAKGLGDISTMPFLKGVRTDTKERAVHQ